MITIVTGQPRSGTSMTMMLLDKGGIPAEHSPNLNSNINPYGSFETTNFQGVIDKCNGKCIKCMTPQILFDVPEGDYKVIMPVRDPEQIIFSRIEAFKMKKMPPNLDRQIGQIERHYRFIRFIISHRPDMQLLEIPYDDYFQKTDKVIGDISTFIGSKFDPVEGKKAIDPEYYEVRTKESVIAKLGEIK